MYEQILKKVIECLKNELEDDEIQVTGECNIMDDLGLSSIEIMTLLGELEETFHVEIPDRYLRKMICVKDIAEIVEQLIEDK